MEFKILIMRLFLKYYSTIDGVQDFDNEIVSPSIILPLMEFKILIMRLFLQYYITTDGDQDFDNEIVSPFLF